MLDPHLLRDNPQYIADQLQKRGFNFDVPQYIALDAQRKALQVATQALQNERNQRSKDIGLAKSRNEDITPMRAEVGRISDEMEATKAKLDAVLHQIEDISLRLPNIPHASVPVGRSEADNLEVRRWGSVPAFDFEVKSHDALGETLGQMDFALASKITGSRFVVMTSQLAKLHRALIQFMLDVHTEEHGYQ